MTKTIEHAVSRRAFVKGSALAGLGAATLGTGTLFACSPQAKTEKGDAANAEAAEERIVWTHCAVNCGSTCALQCHVADGEIKYIESDNTGSCDLGEPQYRACLRGRSLRRWLQSPDRLNKPLKRVAGSKRGEGKYEEITWDEALETIASEMKRIRETYGNEAFFIQYSSGVCSGLFQGNPVMRLMNLAGGFLNCYGTYSSAQMEVISPYVYGDGWSNGSSLSGLQDGQLVVLFGDSLADTRMGGGSATHDLAYLREVKGCRTILIDYRMSDSVCGQGGEWIPIFPGTDGALCDALAYEFIDNGWVDEGFLHTYCVGYDEETMPESAKGQSKSFKDYILGTGYDMTPKTPAWASAITRIPEERIVELAREMAEADPLFVVQGYGVQRHANGEQACRAIMTIPQLLGQVGKLGTNDGRREGAASAGIGMMPVGDNPIVASIPTFQWLNAIRNPESVTALKAGVIGADKLSTGIKFIFNYAGNCITNQHSDINLTHEVLQDESLCEFIVTSEVFMTDSAKYSDIILPDLTSQEQLSVSNNGYADDQVGVIFGQPVYEPKFERRGIYEVCAEIAELLGVGDQFTEGGKSREDWMRELYEDARENDPELPTWDEGMAMGVCKRKPEPIVALLEFVEDPDAHALSTKSGKIELYSEDLADCAAKWDLAEDEVISPIPSFDPGFESYMNLTDEYPLVITGFHCKAHVHSSYANNEIIQAASPHAAWINPNDADARGIEDGDEIRVWTERGEIRIEAKVTPRIIPGVVAIPQGAWHNADMAGDRIDYGGCINTLTIYRGSPLAKANPQHSNIGQIAKA